MSRLESLVRRLEAQRSCLDWACREIRGGKGIVLELGLGNGRTYDHLRRALPAREIFVFERALARETLLPESGHLLLGDIRESLPHFAARHQGKADLIHSDIGSGDAQANAALAAFLAGHFLDLLSPGGLVLADQDIWPGLGSEQFSVLPVTRLSEPPGVPKGRYFIYRRCANLQDRSSTSGT